MSYISALCTKSIDELERYLDDALKEYDYYCENGDEEEVEEALKHVREIRKAMVIVREEAE